MRNCFTRIGLVILLIGSWSGLTDQASAGLDSAGYDSPSSKSAAVARSMPGTVVNSGAFDLLERGREIRRGRLEMGAQQVEAPARALIQSAGAESSRERAELAVGLSPGLPLAHWTLASELARAGDFRGAFSAGLRGVLTIPQHLEARLWFLGCLLLGLAVAIVASSLCFMLAVASAYFRSAAHDLGDLFSSQMPNFARAAVLGACLTLPLALGEGIMGLALVLCLLGIVYGSSRHRIMLAGAGILLVLALFPMTQTAGRLLHALDADPVASSALAAVRGYANSTQLDVLRRAADTSDDVLALRALAVQARRTGDVNAVRERFDRLLEREQGDPMALTVLGNIAFRAGRVADSIAAYELARRQGGSFELLYDLAQAYAKDFRIEDFEFVMAQAQKLDPERAAQFGRLGDPEFVVDPPFPMNEIHNRMWERADGMSLVRFVLAALAPGWLGEHAAHLMVAFALVWLLALLLQGRYRHSSRCLRCGCSICARCDDTIWSSEVCDSCHVLFSRPQTSDRAARALRIQTLQDREWRLRTFSTVFSVLIPGVAGLLARRPDLAFVSIFLFLASMLFWFGRSGPIPEPLALGGAAGLLFVLISGLLFVLYLLTLMRSFGARGSS